jgi:hypothetical protein
MPISRDYHILSYNKEPKIKKEMVVMTYISKEEEILIDKGETVILKRGKCTWLVYPNNVYCYGEVDFHTNSDDMKQIDTFNFLDYLGWSGIPVYSNYHYETHECCGTTRACGWTETWHPAIVAQYAHGCLDKPQRIVLFKVIVK